MQTKIQNYNKFIELVHLTIVAWLKMLNFNQKWRNKKHAFDLSNNKHTIFVHLPPNMLEFVQYENNFKNLCIKDIFGESFFNNVAPPNKSSAVPNSKSQ